MATAEEVAALLQQPAEAVAAALAVDAARSIVLAAYDALRAEAAKSDALRAQTVKAQAELVNYGAMH